MVGGGVLLVESIEKPRATARAAQLQGNDGGELWSYVAPPGYEFTPEERVYINKMTGNGERWKWEIVPSSVGVYRGSGCGFDVVAGFQASGEEAWIFNWRSGELTYVASVGAYAKLTTPELIGVEASDGILVGYGYSNNDMIEGSSFETSISVL